MISNPPQRSDRASEGKGVQPGVPATQLGYRVVAAEDGQEAIDLYRKRGAEIDLVLLDLMMPRMRGEKVFQRLREMNPQARIIISTGNPDLIERFPELRQYAAGFANKPYRVSELGQALEAALAK